MVNIRRFLLSLLPAIGDRPAPVFLSPVFIKNFESVEQASTARFRYISATFQYIKCRYIFQLIHSNPSIFYICLHPIDNSNWRMSART
ncbi:hypothetical protein PILCRDRAFT_356153 [Piloderma croceum F 1598]|uniref:Uncharacterized protein n=1 Tax=Piloderma croceum (strain F 1598) TaxID=765440 RepID=A0A0C3C6K2_PILCF|nr:hypothetical protein PILCRDRAFT_356153 [Piloderma croceum F 1598]